MNDSDGNWPQVFSVTRPDIRELIMQQRVEELMSGWKYRRERGDEKYREKEHVHLKGNGEDYQQGIDGSRRPHQNPPGLPNPPNRVRKKLKEKAGWDWDENAAKPTADKIDSAELLVGVGVVYVGYRVVRILPSLFPPLLWTLPANVAMP